MHGEGKFRHCQGNTYGPIFSNGLFNLQENLFVSPFDTKEQHAALLKRIEQRGIKEAERLKKKKELMRLYRVQNTEEFDEKMNEIRERGRTPFIVTAEEHPQSMESLIEYMQVRQEEIVNLRDLWI